MNIESEVKNVILSNLKEPSDIKIVIEVENIIYNAKDGITSWIDAKLPIIKLQR